MSVHDATFVGSELSKCTSIFGLHLRVVIGILVVSFIVLALFLHSFCLTSCRRRHRCYHKLQHPKGATVTPVVSKEIQKIIHVLPPSKIHVDIRKKEHRVVVYSSRASSEESNGTGVNVCETTLTFDNRSIGPEVSHLEWTRWYTLRGVEVVTNGLCEDSVIREGGYDIVYRGFLRLFWREHGNVGSLNKVDRVWCEFWIFRKEWTLIVDGINRFWIFPQSSTRMNERSGMSFSPIILL